MRVSKLRHGYLLSVFFPFGERLPGVEFRQTPSGQNGDMGTGGHDADMLTSRGDLDSSIQAGSDSRLTDGTAPTDLGMPPNQRRDGWMLTDSGQTS